MQIKIGGCMIPKDLEDETLETSAPGQRYMGLYYGPPGSGKSVLAHAFPRTRTLNFDGPAALDSVAWAIRQGLIDKDPKDVIIKTITQEIIKGQVRTATALDQATDKLDMWLEDWDAWDTLIVDSGTGATDSCIDKGLDENARLNLSKSKETAGGGKIANVPRIMREQDWGSAQSLFTKFINNCRSIDKNFILVCHEYVETDENGSVVRYLPNVIGQLRTTIGKGFGEIYYFYTSGSRTDPKYMIQTAPDSRHTCKSRLGCLPTTMEAEYRLITDTVANYYDLDESGLWTTAKQ